MMFGSRRLKIAFVCAAEWATPVFGEIFKRGARVNVVAWIAFSRVIDVVTDYATILGHGLLLKK